MSMYICVYIYIYIYIYIYVYSNLGDGKETEPRDIGPLLFYSERGILYYSTPREESFTSTSFMSAPRS